MAQNLIEKIVQRFAEGLEVNQQVHSGDFITLKPAYVMTHDNTGAVIPKFRSIGASKLANPRQVVHTLDHNIQDTSEANKQKYARIEAFSAEMGADFYPAGRGIGHQIMCEEGYAFPGTVVVASDSHSNMYGGLGCLGTPVVRTDAAALWATGQTWWSVPRTVKVVLSGKLRPGVVGKDVILALCAVYCHEEALNAAVEFAGQTPQVMAGLSMADRLTIANMTTEWGALVGWFPFDEVTAAYLRQRVEALDKLGIEGRLTEQMVAGWEADPLAPDPDAEYAAEIRLDLSRVTPFVAGPHVVHAGRPLADLEAKNMAVQRAYLLSCVNSRLDDLAQAADVLRGKKVAGGTHLYVAAASAEVQKQAEEQGTWQVFSDAGAELLPPGCGACIGLGVGLLEPGEVGISATNRNFKGRMGSAAAEAYLASPAVVAASAAAGKICGPSTFPSELPELDITDHGWAPAARAVQVLDGFPARMEGRGLLLPVDNLNTDGIYGKDVTYRDDLTPDQMAGYAMANYDPAFQELAQQGDIIVAGRNFGTGSSREQAATALKFRGVVAVIAASFSQTYLRNAYNNAFACLISPELSKAVLGEFSNENGEFEAKTIPFDSLEIDVARSTIRWRGEAYAAAPVGPAAQELVIAGGLEALVKSRL